MPATLPRRPTLAVALVLISGAIATTAILSPLPPLWMLSRAPVGTAMRPMDLEFFLFLCAVGSAFFLVMSRPAAKRSVGFGRLYLFARLAVWLGGLGTVSGFGLYYLVVHVRHFIIES